ncbi:nuclear transport factor 2 family protein [Paraburkholderia sediminicola]|uniref:nuclear transport factor 2 family protein n=1 Tax=Paraburkholderia sediminicola TaxID=458836 RepID=UPI0038BA0294
MIDSNHKAALRELAYRYAQAVDRRDWTMLAALFTPDASVQGPRFSLDGRDAIVAGMGAMAQYRVTQHHVHNQLVEFDGPSARVETYCVAHHLYERDSRTRKLDWGIRYQDRCVCEGGEWRFAHRVLVLDWTQDLPAQE